MQFIKIKANLLQG